MQAVLAQPTDVFLHGELLSMIPQETDLAFA